jgi:hypothetical protein
MTEHRTPTLDDLRQASADPRWQALIDRDERVEASRPKAVPPCPPWCREAPGHRYDSCEADEVTHVRYHESDPKTPVSISQEERNTGGKVTLEPPVIMRWGEDSSEELTAAAARQRAAELLNAADRLDDIQTCFAVDGDR